MSSAHPSRIARAYARARVSNRGTIRRIARLLLGQRLVAQQPKQDVERRLILWVYLEAGALEPLGQHRVAAAVGLHRRLGERQAEQRQVFGLALAAPPVELQAVGVPG